MLVGFGQLEKKLLLLCNSPIKTNKKELTFIDHSLCVRDYAKNLTGIVSSISPRKMMRSVVNHAQFKMKKLRLKTNPICLSI